MAPPACNLSPAACLHPTRTSSVSAGASAAHRLDQGSTRRPCVLLAAPLRPPARLRPSVSLTPTPPVLLRQPSLRVDPTPPAAWRLGPPRHRAVLTAFAPAPPHRRPTVAASRETSTMPANDRVLFEFSNIVYMTSPASGNTLMCSFEF
jgi:hypothetical protein